MKVFLSIKYHPDQSNRERIEQILSILDKLGVKTICVVRDLEKWGTIALDPQDLMQNTLKELRSAHLVIVDLTEKGVGIGIEAGYAHALNIPVMVIAEVGAEISTSLAGIASDIFFYSSWPELEHFFRHALFIQPDH